MKQFLSMITLQILNLRNFQLLFCHNIKQQITPTYNIQLHEQKYANMDTHAPPSLALDLQRVLEIYNHICGNIMKGRGFVIAIEINNQVLAILHWSEQVESCKSFKVQAIQLTPKRIFSPPPPLSFTCLPYSTLPRLKTSLLSHHVAYMPIPFTLTLSHAHLKMIGAWKFSKRTKNYITLYL